MSKRSGFAIKITAFIEADPNDVKSVLEAGQKIDGVRLLIANAGLVDINLTSRFMVSKDIPDPPISPEAKAMDDAIISQLQDAKASPLDIPTALRRA